MKLRPNQLALLGLLAESPSHPYALHQTLHRRNLRQWAPIGFSSVYQVLGALQRQGLVRANIVPAEAAPDRTTYRLTPEGWSALREALREAIGGPPELRYVIELALMFRGTLGAGELDALLAARAEQVEAELARLQASRALAGEWQGFATLIFEHKRLHLEAEREFIARATERLRDEKTHPWSG